MLSSPVEQFLRNTSAGSVTELFLLLIVGVFVVGLINGLQGRARRFTEYTANLMTSIGILGTFTGIVIGLLDFDASDIDGSIPMLLEGLKTAFITSVVGLLGAVLFNFINTVWLLPRAESRFEQAARDEVSEVQPEHIHAALLDIHRGLSGDEEGSLVGQMKMLRSDASGLRELGRLADIEQQLTPTTELSLARALIESAIRQEQALREMCDLQQRQSEQSERNYEHFSKELFGALDRFAEMMSRAATEQIINALKIVIQEFNEKLTEQFGDNFKALDASVKSLVVWQEQYRGQVETMGEQYAQSVQSLVETREAVAGIWAECENIPRAMSELQDVLEVNQHQITELQRHLAAFVTMRDRAVEAVPTIQQSLEQVGEQLTTSTEQLHTRLLETSDSLARGSSEIREALLASSDHLNTSVRTTQQAFNTMAQGIAESSEDMSQTLQTTATEMNQQVRDLLERLLTGSQQLQDEIQKGVGSLGDRTTSIARGLEQATGSLEQYGKEATQDLKRLGESIASEVNTTFSEVQQAMSAHLRQSVSQAGEGINRGLEVLETATTREIEHAMREMGQALTQITGRFVSDYQQLVDAMRRVLDTQLEYQN